MMRAVGLAGRGLTTAAKEKWDIVAGVCLERVPLIARDLKPIEIEFKQLVEKMEFERSHKSDWEVRNDEDKLRAEALKKGIELEKMDAIPHQTAQDFLDIAKEELKQFKFAEPKCTEGKGSSRREMDRRLVLLIKEKLGSNQWILPQGKHESGTLRETAEKVLETATPGVSSKILGNAPYGFYKYRYPKSLHLESVGAKIFFFKAQLLQPYVNEDVHWATRKELAEVLPKRYFNSVNMFLIDEEH